MSQVRGKSASSKLPRKRFYRARAHSNPLSDSHFPVPVSPAEFDYSEHFPAYFDRTPAPNSNDKDGEEIEGPPSKTGKSNDPTKDAEDASSEPAERSEISIASENYSKSEDSTEATEANGLKHDISTKIRFADIGCGFGGLLVKLSTMFPSKLMIGMELRDKVSEYVKERILALRKAHPGQYQNISVVRTNSMKFLPNYFEKGELEKMFFLFPDPHFKEKNHRRRVISVPLLAEYAYAMAVGGILYTVTDVEELGDWMKGCLDAHPLFEKVPEEEVKNDPVVNLLTTATEEGQKVARNEGQTFMAIYRRIACNEGA